MLKCRRRREKRNFIISGVYCGICVYLCDIATLIALDELIF